MRKKTGGEELRQGGAGNAGHWNESLWQVKNESRRERSKRRSEARKLGGRLLRKNRLLCKMLGHPLGKMLKQTIKDWHSHQQTKVTEFHNIPEKRLVIFRDELYRVVFFTVPP